MRPPQQGFRTDDPTGIQIDLRLVVQHQFGMLHCPGQFVVQRPAGDDRATHGLFEQTEAAPPVPLGLIERQIRIGDQLVAGGAGTTNRRSDAEAYMEDVSRHRERGLEDLEDSRGEGFRFQRVALSRQEKSEFVPAETRHRNFGRDAGRQPYRHSLE